MEDLGGLVLDGLHLDLVRRVLPLAGLQRLLESVQRVDRDGVPAGPQELCQLLAPTGQRSVSGQTRVSEGPDTSH